MGWRDVGFAGNKFVETPNLDRLAKTGLVFTQSYANAPNCAPTRACLMSGQTPPRHGIYTVVDPRQPPGSPWHKLLAAESQSELATTKTTLAEALRSADYATACFGMWNLGRGRTGPVSPRGQGFEHVVFPEDVSFAKDAYFNDKGEYLSDRLMDETLSFVETQRERPFFVYLADHAVHAPLNPKPDLLEKYERKAQATGERGDPAYAATIEAVDQNIGRLMEKLKSLKLDQNTYVVFTSDNGGTRQYTAPLKGSKGELYEGGIRVPLVVAGPGIKNRGSYCDAPVASIDLMPTFLELAGASVVGDQPLDGVSLVRVWRGESQLAPRKMFWHFPCYVGRAPPSSAIRDGDFKLIEFFENGGRHELYNLRDDPNEQRDLSAQMPAKANEMLKLLHEWQMETGAALPVGENPKYDPKAERPRGGANPGAKGGRKMKANK